MQNNNNNDDDNKTTIIIIIMIIIFFKLHMEFFCKQKNLQLIIYSYSNTLHSRAYYSRRLNQSLPV